MDDKAQISFEYLLTVAFALLLVLAAIIAAMNLGNLSQIARGKISDARDETIASLMG